MLTKPIDEELLQKSCDEMGADVDKAEPNQTTDGSTREMPKDIGVDTRPLYPDASFESDLVAFIAKKWPCSAWAGALKDIARSTFYEDYDPQLTWVGLPSADFQSIIAFASAQLDNRGFCRS